MSSVTPPRVTALLLAGRRPGIDPLAARFGIEDKALIPVGGEAMLSRVARTLTEHPRIARVIVLAQAGDELASLADTRWMASHPKIAFRAGGGSVSQAIADALDDASYPYLATTADNVLLDGAMLDAFLDGAAGSDIAAGVVERRTLLAGYPESRRTWLKFRGGAYSGANLFWFGRPEVKRVLALWRTIEQDRKRGRAVIGAFGPLMLLGVALRILTLRQALATAGRHFGLDARAVVLPFAEACIDVDKPDDLTLVEEILARRADR